MSGARRGVSEYPLHCTGYKQAMSGTLHAFLVAFKFSSCDIVAPMGAVEGCLAGGKSR